MSTTYDRPDGAIDCNDVSLYGGKGTPIHLILTAREQFYTDRMVEDDREAPENAWHEMLALSYAAQYGYGFDYTNDPALEN